MHGIVSQRAAVNDSQLLGISVAPLAEPFTLCSSNGPPKLTQLGIKSWPSAPESAGSSRLEQPAAP